MVNLTQKPPRAKAVSRKIILFLIVAVAGAALAAVWLDPVRSFMIGFDAGAAAFILSSLHLLKLKTRDDMVAHATVEDGGRIYLLMIAGLVSLAVLGAVVIELGGSGTLTLAQALLVVGTLALAWIFGNLIYAFHYAHLHYVAGAGSKKDKRGVTFPGTDIPDYWDFLYFSLTLGMTFQTSDVTIESPRIRRVVIFQCLAAFVFNLGIIGFTINLLGSLGGN
jgi:uncharacterized membrane protein